MTQAEKKRLSAVLHAAEFLFLENIALKLVLEHRAVPNWQKLVDHLLADKEMLGGVRLTFRGLYHEIERSSDPSAALEAFLGKLPSTEKDAVALDERNGDLTLTDLKRVVWLHGI